MQRFNAYDTANDLNCYPKPPEEIMCKVDKYSFPTSNDFLHTNIMRCAQEGFQEDTNAETEAATVMAHNIDSNADGSAYDAEVLNVFDDGTELSGECRMENFMHHIQSQSAIPDYALSDEVFNVDKPPEAVGLGADLAVKRLSQDQKVGNELLITVTEVYSPFQFWFLEADDATLLKEMSSHILQFFNNAHGISWLLPPYFIKPGFICAACHDYVWKRARILNVLSSTEVTVHLMDYGQNTQLPVDQLKFLHQNFMSRPALAMRGTLTDVFPLDLHWPTDATAYFKHLVDNRDLYAIIKDADVEDRILFVNLCERSDFQRSISDELIHAKLAGFSNNYSAEMLQANHGRRIRYIRERLPSFEMLELQLFVSDSDKSEEQFDEIIYNPQFLRYFKPPKLANPFRCDLENALASWLEKFKRMELAWRNMIPK
ncbi:hypothetical protein KR044_013436 [Drosophila immigrans]|nr:hypothetical protein KR044_013436 [Drosophila immigrans]